MFGKRFRLFKLLGFQVKLDVSWLIIAVLVTWTLAVGVFPHRFPGLTPATYWIMGAAGACGLFASIVFHEFAHSLVARRFGIEMSGITFFVFGGVAGMREEPRSPKAEFFMAIAGPVSSVVLVAVFLALAQWGQAGGWPPQLYGVLGYLRLDQCDLGRFQSDSRVSSRWRARGALDYLELGSKLPRGDADRDCDWVRFRTAVDGPRRSRFCAWQFHRRYLVVHDWAVPAKRGPDVVSTGVDARGVNGRTVAPVYECRSGNSVTIDLGARVR